MIQKDYEIEKLFIQRNEGVNIDGLKMSGVGTYVAETKTFTFVQTPKRQKSGGKNPALYKGDYASLRLHKDGSSRVTITLQAKLIVDEVKDQIIKEVRECLKRM